MRDIESLRKRIEHVSVECKEIVEIISSELENLSPSIPVDTKEIDKIMEKFRKLGIDMPVELKSLKQKSTAPEIFYDFLLLADNFLTSLEGITSIDTVKKIKQTIKTGKKRSLNDFNYERPLGSKGNEQLKDYLIPVINFMNAGDDHIEAFKKVAIILDVRKETVISQCTRSLGLKTDQFVSKVQNGKIINLIESKFPDRIDEIREGIR